MENLVINIYERQTNTYGLTNLILAELQCYINKFEPKLKCSKEIWDSKIGISDCSGEYRVDLIRKNLTKDLTKLFNGFNKDYTDNTTIDDVINCLHARDIFRDLVKSLEIKKIIIKEAEEFILEPKNIDEIEELGKDIIVYKEYHEKDE